MKAHLLRDIPHRPQRLGSLLLLRRNRQRQAVDKHILPRDPITLRRPDDFFRDGDTRLPGFGDAVFIQAQPHHRRAVFFAQGQNRVQNLLPSVYGIENRPAAAIPQPGLDGGGIGGVDLERQIAHGLDCLHHFCHHFRLINTRKPHIHI